VNRRIEELHEQAMSLSDEAFVAKRRENFDLARQLYHRSLDLEVAAAELLKGDLTAEPTRSVLYRSAASIAMDCENLRLAEQLIATALAGDPPQEIAEELRDLLEQVNFQRHLGLRGFTLQENEFQVSFVGRSIGLGVAVSDEVVGRIEGIYKLIYRTIERIQEMPYRDSGSAGKEAKSFPVLISVPRPGSFAISFSVGNAEQPSFFRQVNPIDVVDEVVSCLSLLNDSKTDELNAKINSPDYFENFLELAIALAPSGEAVRSINITTIRNSQERGFEFKKTRNELNQSLKYWHARNRGKSVTIRGYIKLADSVRDGAESRLILVDDENKRHRIVATREDIDKLVKSRWNSYVDVTGKYNSDGLIVLEQIKKVRKKV
jgi:hypothetical protein